MLSAVYQCANTAAPVHPHFSSDLKREPMGLRTASQGCVVLYSGGSVIRFTAPLESMELRQSSVDNSILLGCGRDEGFR